MSAPAILDLSERRQGTPRTKKRPATPLTRNALIADFLSLCELDHEIESLRAPADPAAFQVDERNIEHIADFEIVRDGQSFLVDILTDEDLLTHPLRTAAIHGLAAQDGRHFSIETAASIRAEPRFSTVRLITACRRTPVTAGDRVRILHQLDEVGTMRLVDCAGAVMNTQDGVAAVLALACEGLVTVDIHRPILPETQVRRRRLPFTDPFSF